MQRERPAGDEDDDRDDGEVVEKDEHVSPDHAPDVHGQRQIDLLQDVLGLYVYEAGLVDDRDDQRPHDEANGDMGHEIG